ncbi:NUDIX hydrolase [Convivina praedatoris]|uniref:Methanol dehydrogenase activator n=1 Tax=Convivina praedatoris TaxID=2880963 RepID=A0ABM9D1C5_9LACO|nr:NUDIX hydrolase [Convivina sp. LMG 32447]CAH1849992.1 Methanol dehydrogenase activator [Convivina sp. LMG 32447]CAH1849994.1 Methanol dehydrogenase activator [Convivina sp. LMG 32447]CAH1851224.1 Methanol dehydrogenase activator [Convivina sp. LMG 32447]
MANKEKYLSGQVVYQGPIFAVEKQQVSLSDGTQVQRDVILHQPSVAILAFIDDDHILIERQWRATIQDFTWEIPAGKVDQRDQDNLRQAAIRELNEELRLEAQKLVPALTFYQAVGFSDAQLTLFTAEQLSPVAQEAILPRDQGESLDILTISFDELSQWFAQGKINDQKTLLAFLYWANLRKG